MPYVADAAHTTKKSTHLPTAQKTKKEPHKRAYLVSENGALRRKRSGEWAKSRKDKTERATGLGRRMMESDNTVELLSRLFSMLACR